MIKRLLIIALVCSYSIYSRANKQDVADESRAEVDVPAFTKQHVTSSIRSTKGRKMKHVPLKPIITGDWLTLLTKEETSSTDLSCGSVVDHCFFRDKT